jgi:trehalose 6-phosphate synthase
VARTVRFLGVLILALGVLAGTAFLVVQRTTRGWFERDLSLRAELAANSVRERLVEHWQDGPGPLGELLSDIARDERIMSGALCSDDLRALAVTRDYPRELSCESLATRVQPVRGQWGTWSSVTSLPGGEAYVSALPVVEKGRSFGFLVLVQDLSYVQRRDAQTRNFLLLAFGMLALAASATTVFAARLAWRGWSTELRRMLRGGKNRPEFQPILGDVRDLVAQLAAEADTEREAGAWTAARLKKSLARYLHGERVVLVANREPYIHNRDGDGLITVVHPASGLVTALEPVMRACSGVWVAHGSGTADRECSDANDRVRVPPGEESYVLRRVWLSAAEEQGYYYGFSNEGLWPLCHIAHARPVFRSEDWAHYQAVNRRFAEAVFAEVDSEDPIILVQDYHFALAPKFIRERLPRATVITFWHVPWPNFERFGICPWRKELLEGLLGSSILGFHTRFHCNNFLDAVDRFLEARIDREENAVVQGGRMTLVRPYPISIEWPARWLENCPPVAACRASVRAELGLAPDALLGVGIDRLDYTKGIEERLLAVERLLERAPELRGKLTFAQLAAPSRTAIDRYRELNEAIEGLAARVNLRFGNDGYRPIALLRAHHEPPTVFRYYRAADLCYVSSLHDGMNLVAKEFVAARDDEQGVLVLSQFAGAARELTEALIVNPYDLEEASAALKAALDMPEAEQRDRMRAMRALVAEYNVHRWAGRMLMDAARLRRRDRLAGKLNERWMRGAGAGAGA